MKVFEDRSLCLHRHPSLLPRLRWSLRMSASFRILVIFCPVLFRSIVGSLPLPPDVPVLMSFLPIKNPLIPNMRQADVKSFSFWSGLTYLPHLSISHLIFAHKTILPIDDVRFLFRYKDLWAYESVSHLNSFLSGLSASFRNEYNTSVNPCLFNL